MYWGAKGQLIDTLCGKILGAKISLSPPSITAKALQKGLFAESIPVCPLAFSDAVYIISSAIDVKPVPSAESGEPMTMWSINSSPTRLAPSFSLTVVS